MAVATISVNFANQTDVVNGISTSQSINPAVLKAALQSGASLYSIQGSSAGFTGNVTGNTVGSAGSSTIQGSVGNFSGTVTASNFVGDVPGVIPIGGIIIWSGAIGAVPSGWNLCDGSNGTPDLRSRFVVGAGQGTGLSNYAVGDTGGSESVTLTVAQMPSHSHSTRGMACTTTCGGSFRGDGSAGGTVVTNSAGGDQAHENRSPYYALAYIMRTT